MEYPPSLTAAAQAKAVKKLRRTGALRASAFAEASSTFRILKGSPESVLPQENLLEVRDQINRWLYSE